MKIVFAGSSDFSAFHLGILLKSKNRVSTVLTQPDRKSGRGRKILFSPVKELAIKKNIPVLQPKNLKNNKSLFQKLTGQSPDLILVVAYGLIVPKEILSLPRLGCINVHASLLPRWRGAAPIERSIFAGDKNTGITFIQMEEGLDTGPILHKASCSINEKEDSGSLEDKLKKLSKRELIKFLENFSRFKATEVNQNHKKATYAKKITNEDKEIFWDMSSAEDIEKQVRALFPKNCAHTYLGSKRVNILSAKVNQTKVDLAPGYIFLDPEGIIHVGCKSRNSLTIEILQLAGKKEMRSIDFVNGNKYRILENIKFSSSVS